MENKNKTNVLLSIAILLLVALCIIGIGIYKVWKDSAVQTAVINTNTANMNTMTTDSMVTVSNGDPQSETKSRTNNSSIEVSSAIEMTDTQILVKKNDKIQITANGRVNAATDNKDGAFSWVDPDGWKSEPSFNAERKGLSRSLSSLQKR
jgi:cytoskeletal protein RodZ